MLSLDAKVQIVGTSRGSTATTKSLVNSSNRVSSHMSVKEEETSQDEDNEKWQITSLS